MLTPEYQTYRKGQTMSDYRIVLRWANSDDPEAVQGGILADVFEASPDVIAEVGCDDYFNVPAFPPGTPMDLARDHLATEYPNNVVTVMDGTEEPETFGIDQILAVLRGGLDF
jgi:hypothetical protein